LSEVTRWWWIRHAPVDSGGRIYGQCDLPADCGDARLFAGLAARLPQDALWVTTPLGRTGQTAEAILAQGDHRPRQRHEEGRFAEQHFGEWQGLSHDELRQRQAPEWHRFWLAPAEATPPGGESFAAVVARVNAGVEELSAQHRGGDIVCVAHGGSIRAALAVALRIEPERALSFAIDNCSLTRIDHIAGATGSHAPEETGSWRVGLVNFPPHSDVS
jgi:broad specificity phosphatase PhoE